MIPTTNKWGMAFMLAVLLVTGVMLAGCNVSDIPSAQIPDICRAMIGPIHYNSTNPHSKRYAAYLLKMDLAERNRVYIALHCPKD